MDNRRTLRLPQRKGVARWAGAAGDACDATEAPGERMAEDYTKLNENSLWVRDSRVRTGPKVKV